ncbi:hypothetical protein [Pseudoflavonifractor phocaeensis]|uniref:hypothetical protein n=1 Tax=Pseudoflavonifractor phocaeensis TaxID=1870988 RepID=UPI0019599002|nr:hypothetical protein [Pseudoflavonifractor phocaeensis]MBM6888054.1 hypothetical protein [Pseudoflavonifractor phocaeensis]
MSTADNTLVEIYNPSTYPEDIRILMSQYQDLLNRYEFDPQSDLGDFDKWLHRDGIKAKGSKLRKQFEEAMGDCWLEGFHITRTFQNKELVQKYYGDRGLLFPDNAFAKDYFDDMLAQIDCQREAVDFFVRGFYSVLFNDDNVFIRPRRELLSLFAAPSQYVLYESLGGYWNVYGQRLFGEISKEIFRKIGHPVIDKIYKTLLDITCPYIIRLRFRISDVTEKQSEYPKDFVISQLIGIMGSKYFRNASRRKVPINADNSVFCAQLDHEIVKDNILGIFSMDEWEEQSTNG